MKRSHGVVAKGSSGSGTQAGVNCVDNIHAIHITPHVVLSGLRHVIEAMYAYQKGLNAEGMCVSNVCYLLDLMDPPRVRWHAKALYALWKKDDGVVISAHAVVVHNGIVFDCSYETAQRGRDTVYADDLLSMEATAAKICPGLSLGVDEKRYFLNNFMSVHTGCAAINAGRSFISCPNGDEAAGRRYLDGQHQHVHSVLAGHSSLPMRHFWTVVKGHYRK